MNKIMTKRSSTRKPLSKSNSPVGKTGQKRTSKKSVLKQVSKEISAGREKILLDARGCFAVHGFASTSMKDQVKRSQQAIKAEKARQKIKAGQQALAKSFS